VRDGVGIEDCGPRPESPRTRFVLGEVELQGIPTLLPREEKVDRGYRVDLTDARGEVCALVEKTLHIRRRALPSRGRWSCAAGGSLPGPGA
jgi:hypothetical protein